MTSWAGSGPSTLQNWQTLELQYLIVIHGGTLRLVRQGLKDSGGTTFGAAF